MSKIVRDKGIMGGKPFLEGTRVTVKTLVNLFGAGRTMEEVLLDYPYLNKLDVLAALNYHYDFGG